MDMLHVLAGDCEDSPDVVVQGHVGQLVHVAIHVRQEL